MAKSKLVGKKVIVRGNRSGVFFGTLQEQEGQDVALKECRKLWYWNGAAAVEQIANDGVSKPHDCKFTVTVPELYLTDVIQIIPCTKKAIDCIEAVKAWTR